MRNGFCCGSAWLKSPPGIQTRCLRRPWLLKICCWPTPSFRPNCTHCRVYPGYRSSAPRNPGHGGQDRERYGVKAVRVVHPGQCGGPGPRGSSWQLCFLPKTSAARQIVRSAQGRTVRRTLAGHSAWLTGQHRDQSPTRGHLAESEYDAVFGFAEVQPAGQLDQRPDGKWCAPSNGRITRCTIRAIHR